MSAELWDKIIVALPLFFYLTGSICFAIGSLILLYRSF